MLRRDSVVRRLAAPILVVSLALGTVACGDGEADDRAAATTPDAVLPTSGTLPGTIGATTSPTLPTPSSTRPDGPTETYRVVAGDSLYSIARQHCTSVDDLVAANGWANGADHVIHPNDPVLVPGAPCNRDTTSVATPPSTSAAPDVDEPPTSWSSPWGDPADDGVTYATPECTELREAYNGLHGTPALDEDGDLGSEPQQLADRFLAALAAMPDPPDSAAAVMGGVDVLTRNRATYATIEWDLVKRDILPPDNPAWPALRADLDAHQTDLEALDSFVSASCPPSTTT